MSDVHRSSSKSRYVLAMTLMASTLLGGCSQTTGNLFAGSFASSQKQQQSTDLVIAAPVAEKASTQIDDMKVASLEKKNKPKGEASSVSAYKIDENSAWCRYLKNDAAANAEIVASPTLSASSDEKGNGSFNIGMNLLDIKKADLIRQSGEARCQAHAAGKSIEVTMRLANESTKFASDYAQYKYLEARQQEMAAIVLKAKGLTSAGILTVQQASELEKTEQDIKAEMNLAKSEADKRKDIPAINTVHVAGSNAKLQQATQRLQSIDRDIRTIEAFDISVQAGYRYEDPLTLNTNTNDYYARVKFGVRLGALSSRRNQYEDAAESARLEALGEENSGPLWQSDFAASSIGKALVGLRSARGNLVAALSSAKDTAAKLNNSERPELVFAALQSKMNIISIGGKLSGVDASINELEAGQKRLSALAR